MDNIITRDYIDKVRASGRPIHMHSKFCNIHNKINNNCNGCESQEGCKIVTACVGLHAISAVYPNKISMDKACSLADKVIKGSVPIEHINDIIQSNGQ